MSPGSDDGAFEQLQDVSYCSSVSLGYNLLEGQLAKVTMVRHKFLVSVN